MMTQHNTGIRKEEFPQGHPMRAWIEFTENVAKPMSRDQTPIQFMAVAMKRTADAIESGNLDLLVFSRGTPPLDPRHVHEEDVAAKLREPYERFRRELKLTVTAVVNNAEIDPSIISLFASSEKRRNLKTTRFLLQVIRTVLEVLERKQGEALSALQFGTQTKRSVLWTPEQEPGDDMHLDFWKGIVSELRTAANMALEGRVG